MVNQEGADTEQTVELPSTKGDNDLPASLVTSDESLYVGDDIRELKNGYQHSITPREWGALTGITNEFPFGLRHIVLYAEEAYLK